MSSFHGWEPRPGFDDRFKQFDEDPFFKDSDKWFRKASIRYAILSVIVGISAALYLGYLLNQLNTRQTETAQRIGQKVIMGSDTLMIVDYSTLKKTYTLDSGIEISIELADKLVIKDTK